MRNGVLLDPTNERKPSVRPRAPRLTSLKGRKVGLLDISKARSDVFLDRLAELLAARGVEIQRFRKPTFAKIAPAHLRQEIGERCDALIEALAD